MIDSVALQRLRPLLAGRIRSLVSIGLRDESGRLLPGAAVGDRWFVVGEKGRRYSIVVRNHTHARLEVVLSVDGLDVMDGRTASFGKRGYIVPPRGTVRVEGFRRSSDAVAAFRFSSVSDSYANLNTATHATLVSSAWLFSTNTAPTRSIQAKPNDGCGPIRFLADSRRRRSQTRSGRRGGSVAPARVPLLRSADAEILHQDLRLPDERARLRQVAHAHGAGLSPVAHEGDADVILLNTCSVRDMAEQKALGKMGMMGAIANAGRKWSSVFSAAWRRRAAITLRPSPARRSGGRHAEVSPRRGLRGRTGGKEPRAADGR